MKRVKNIDPETFIQMWVNVEDVASELKFTIDVTAGDKPSFRVDMEQKSVVLVATPTTDHLDLLILAANGTRETFQRLMGLFPGLFEMGIMNSKDAKYAIKDREDWTISFLNSQYQAVTQARREGLSLKAAPGSYLKAMKPGVVKALTLNPLDVILTSSAPPRS